MYVSGLPLSGQADVRLFWTALAQGEQFPDDLLGFDQDQGGAGLQLCITLLEGQVSRPEASYRGHIQEPICRQASQEGFEFICRETGRGKGAEEGKVRDGESRTKLDVLK